MTQAIQTKYLGPTNFHGARVRAWCEADHVMFPWDGRLNQSNNHKAAAFALANKLGWDGVWVGGGLPSSSGYAFVLVTGDERDGFEIVAKQGE